MTVRAVIRRRIGTLDLDVDLHVESGEVLALLGPNGAGKSTVLRCLAGLAAIDHGVVEIGGVVVDDPAAAVLLAPEHRSVGIVFQDHLLFPHLSVLENVAFGLRARGTDRAEARKVAAAWLERMDLAAYAAERPLALSGGQSQRVALARALAVDPKVLLLDEPLAALDVGTRADVRRELRRHLEAFSGVTVLVTHDPVDAHALAGRVAVVESGRVVQSGTLAEVTAHPRSRYVADLVGVNLVVGEVTDGVLRTSTGARVVIADALDGPAHAIIRPHSVSVLRDAPVGSSVRNVWRAEIADVDRLGNRVRLVLHGELPLVAEITAAAMASLDLRPGDDVHATVKATDIDVEAR